MKIRALIAAALLALTLGASAAPAADAVPTTPVQRVILIVEENHSRSQINATNMPYLVGELVPQYSEATHLKALFHPSLPNYLALTGGSNFGVTNDSGPSAHKINQSSIYSQFGGSWAGYHDGMIHNCALNNEGDHYIVHHNPAPYYTFTGTRTACLAQDKPFNQLEATDGAAVTGTIRQFTIIVPNNCHNGHKNTCSNGTSGTLDGQARQSDDWLHTILPPILATSGFQDGSTLVEITWDEGHSEQTVETVFLSTLEPAGEKLTGAYTHYSLLRFNEFLFGKPLLRGAATANNLCNEFTVIC